MKLKDFVMLKKLMMMTMSGAEAEAAFALKKANDLLRAEGIDWDRVLNRVVQVDFETAEAEVEPDDERTQVEAAFEAVEKSDPRGSFSTFIDSLKEQWQNKGHLSINQRDALFKAARRAQEGIRR